MSRKIEPIGSHIVDLFPLNEETATGTLEAGGRVFPVTVTYEKQRRLRARVQIAEDIKKNECLDSRSRAFYAAALLALDNPAFRRLGIDPRDGEVLYSATITCDMTTDALDRFFADARAFIESNLVTLDRLIEGYE